MTDASISTVCKKLVDDGVRRFMIGLGAIIGDEAVAKHQLGAAPDILLRHVETSVEHGESLARRARVLGSARSGAPLQIAFHELGRCRVAGACGLHERDRASRNGLRNGDLPHRFLQSEHFRASPDFFKGGGRIHGGFQQDSHSSAWRE